MSSLEEKLSSRQTDLHLSILFGICASWVTLVWEKSVVCCQRTRPLSPSFIFIQFLRYLWGRFFLKNLQFESINNLLIFQHLSMIIFRRGPHVCRNAHNEMSEETYFIFTNRLKSEIVWLMNFGKQILKTHGHKHKNKQGWTFLNE